VDQLAANSVNDETPFMLISSGVAEIFNTVKESVGLMREGVNRDVALLHAEAENLRTMLAQADEDMADDELDEEDISGLTCKGRGNEAKKDKRARANRLGVQAENQAELRALGVRTLSMMLYKKFLYKTSL
jgi:hypothetical protein